MSGWYAVPDVPVVVFVVLGVPAPQGSKNAYVNKRTGRAVVVESSKKVKPWREAVRSAAADAYDAPPLEGAVYVEITFTVARPKSHYGTGKNADVLKPSALLFPTSKPDLDKLLRSTLDAIKDAGVLRDDARVVVIRTRKVWAGKKMAETHPDSLRAPGAVVRIWVEGTK